VVFHDGKLTLDQNYFWVDLWAFDRALGAVSECLRDPALASSQAQLVALANRALSLYMGSFLGDEDSSWAINARDQWKSRFVRFACETADALKTNGQLDEAIAFLQASLDAEDQAESIYRQLMLYYLAQGRRAEGIDTYNRCSNMLSAGPGVNPSPETLKIHGELMAGGESD